MPDVVVAGAAGRMGSRVVACLQDAPDLRLVGALEAPGHPALGKDAGEVAGVGRLGVPIAADPAQALTRERISSSSPSPTPRSNTSAWSVALAAGQ